MHFQQSKFQSHFTTNISVKFFSRYCSRSNPMKMIQCSISHGFSHRNSGLASGGIASRLFILILKFGHAKVYEILLTVSLIHDIIARQNGNDCFRSAGNFVIITLICV